jgi:hypothetical protein
MSVPTPFPIFPFKDGKWYPGTADYLPPRQAPPPPTQPTPLFAGEGFLHAVVTALLTGTVPVAGGFTGSGQLNAVVNQLPQIVRWPQLFGQGTLSATVEPMRFEFSGEGTLSAMILAPYSIDARFRGGGTLSAKIGRPTIPVRFTGAGTLSAAVTPQ